MRVARSLIFVRSISIGSLRGGRKNSESRIQNSGVGIKPCHQAALSGEHAARFGGGALVVLAKQVQDAVNEEDADLFFDRGATFLCLPGGRVEGDDDITDEAATVARGGVDGKREHVGRPVCFPVTSVQAMDFLIPYQCNAQLGIDLENAQKSVRVPTYPVGADAAHPPFGC